MNQKRKELCYRVAKPDGTGMYYHFGGTLNDMDIEMGGQYHPGPMDDVLLSEIWFSLLNNNYEYQNYHFGFSTMEQLRRWLFKAEVNAMMHENGLSIYIYQTDDYHIGDTQMVFRKSTATLVGKVDLI